MRQICRDGLNKPKLCSDLSIFMIMVVVLCVFFIFMNPHWNRVEAEEFRVLNNSVSVSHPMFIPIQLKATQFIHFVRVCESEFPRNKRNGWARGIEMRLKWRRRRKKKQTNRNVEWCARGSQGHVDNRHIAFHLADATHTPAPFRMEELRHNVGTRRRRTKTHHVTPNEYR